MRNRTIHSSIFQWSFDFMCEYLIRCLFLRQMRVLKRMNFLLSFFFSWNPEAPDETFCAAKLISVHWLTPTWCCTFLTFSCFGILIQDTFKVSLAVSFCIDDMTRCRRRLPFFVNHIALRFVLAPVSVSCQTDFEVYVGSPFELIPSRVFREIVKLFVELRTSFTFPVTSGSAVQGQFSKVVQWGGKIEMLSFSLSKQHFRA